MVVHTCNPLDGGGWKIVLNLRLHRLRNCSQHTNLSGSPTVYTLSWSPCLSSLPASLVFLDCSWSFKTLEMKENSRTYLEDDGQCH